MPTQTSLSGGKAVHLPNELWMRILSHTAAEDVVTMRLVSKRMNALASDGQVVSAVLGPAGVQIHSGRGNKTLLGAFLRDQAVSRKLRRGEFTAKRVELKYGDVEYNRWMSPLEERCRCECPQNNWKPAIIGLAQRTMYNRVSRCQASRDLIVRSCECQPMSIQDARNVQPAFRKFSGAGNPRGLVFNAAASVDGSTLLTVHWDREDVTRAEGVHLWLLSAKDWQRRLLSHAGAAGVAMTPDARLAVSGAHDGSVVVWDLRGGRALNTFNQDGIVYHVAIAANGSKIAAFGSQGNIDVWALDGGRSHKLAYMRPNTEAHHKRHNFITFSRNGDFLATRKPATLWDLRNDDATKLVTYARLGTFSPDGLSFAYADIGPEPDFIDPVRLLHLGGESLHTETLLGAYDPLPEYIYEVADLSYAPYGNRLVATCIRAVTVWELDHPSKRTTSFAGPLGHSLRRAYFAANGTKLEARGWCKSVTFDFAPQRAPTTLWAKARRALTEPANDPLEDVEVVQNDDPAPLYLGVVGHP